ncbi:MAG: nuclear transport factor 2 family protein [Pseudomonadales bacterium]
MTNHIDSLRAIIEAWRQLDIDTVLSYVHDDISWQNSGGQKPPLKGKAAMRAEMEAFAEIIAEDKWRLFDWQENGDTLWMEGVEEFTTKDGKRVVIPYAGVLEFQDGLILNWREYYSDGLMGQLMNGEAVPPHTDEFIDRPEV